MGTLDPGPRLNDELTAAMRRWARSTSPRELEARGISRVHAVSLSRVAAVLEKAVNRTLIRRTLDGATDDALSLSAETREEFLRLVKAGSAPNATEITGRATSTLQRLRAEVAARRAALAVDERASAAAPAAVESRAARDERGAELVGRLRDLFASFGGDRDVPVELERRVVALVESGVEAVVRSEREFRRQEHHRDIAILDRRIAKLQSLLESTESELARTRAFHAHDPGVGSMYDSVQGLSPQDPRRQVKNELMLAIYEANRAMREMRAGRAELRRDERS